MPLTCSLLASLLTVLPFDTALGDSHDGRADKTRQGYSLFGIGMNIVDYEENASPIVAGNSVDIETEESIILTHNSRVFVSIDDEWGFYISGNSSLGVPTSEESWEIDETAVRTNQVSFEQQRLTVLGSRRTGSSGYWLLGARYGKTEFSRFDTALTDAAPALGVDESTFSLGTVEENVWDISALFGYERSTLFTNSQPGWKHQLRLLAGVPLITTISNTDVDAGNSFTDRLSGYQISASGAYGYQFNEHLLAVLSLELSLAHRNRIGRDVSADEAEGPDTRFPANDQIHVFPSIGVLWSF